MFFCWRFNFNGASDCNSLPFFQVQDAVKRYFRDRFCVRIARERRESNISCTKLAGSSVDTNPVSIPLSANPLQNEEDSGATANGPLNPKRV